MGFFYNKYNIEIDPNLLDELKDYVAAENIKSTIENLIKNYIEQKKPAMSANQEKVARNKIVNIEKSFALFLKPKIVMVVF